MTSRAENLFHRLSAENKSEMIYAVRDTLNDMAEPEYQRFSSKLLPDVDNILGVRLPKLRKYARQIMKTYGLAYLDTIESVEFMEEILLQGMVIGQLRLETEKKSSKSSDRITIAQIQDYIRKYVPKINNWSTCDSFCAGLKITKEYPAQMWEFLQTYLASERDYDVRFGIVMIINYYIQDAYIEKLFEIFDRVGKKWCTQKTQDGQETQGIYYVEMALAWAISICYVQYPDKTLIYLQERRTADTVLDDFTYNKALQKIVESHCVSPEKKAEIKLMKRSK